MGMGGGTLTIPLLTIFVRLRSIRRRLSILVAFIPMAAVTLIIHTKNHLVEYKKALPLAVPALITSVLCSFAALKTKSGVLALCYGIFLTALGVYQLATVIINCVRKKKERSKCLREGRRE